MATERFDLRWSPSLAGYVSAYALGTPPADEWVLPVVPAVLSEELVEKVARAWAEEIGDGDLFAPDAELPGEAERNAIFRQALLKDTRIVLRAAGFVSEPSTGGDDELPA